MVKRIAIALFCLLSLSTMAQEVLRPLEAIPATKRHATKQNHSAVELPFFDDFATGRLDPTLWAPTGGATASFDVSPLAPTVGIATLDALGSDGFLHPNASTNLFPADTLCSMPIRLDSMTATDSVVLSFWWMPGGGYGNLWERVGDTPDPADSLFLDFYRPTDSTWVTVWSQSGIGVDSLMTATGTAWQYTAVAVDNDAFFDSLFRFRFRNYASLEHSSKAGRAGNCDYWHLDYILLDHSRSSIAAPESHDMAFAAPAPTMLARYRSMPFRQYTPDDMASQLQLNITNLHSSTLASHYGYAVLDSLGNELASYDGGFENLAPHQPGDIYQTAAAHANPPVQYSFPTMTAPTAYTVVHTVREGTAGDDRPLNDTVRYRQLFADYYAYDDGSAENGYGLTSTASKVYLAYRFVLGQPDTITAIDIYFNLTYDHQNENIAFFLTLWGEQEEAPGTVIYRDATPRHPVGGQFHRYILERPVPLSGTFFVGFEQVGNDFINLGFDRSFNTARHIYYLTGTQWQSSILSGSLMLRPCLGAAAAVGLTPTDGHTSPLRLYPNPARDRIWIDGVVPGSLVSLYDLQGHLQQAPTTANATALTLAIGHLPVGPYLLSITDPQGHVFTYRLLIQH